MPRSVPDEEDLAAARAQFASHGEQGNDVAAGAAAGEGRDSGGRGPGAGGRGCGLASLAHRRLARAFRRA